MRVEITAPAKGTKAKGGQDQQEFGQTASSSQAKCGISGTHNFNFNTTTKLCNISNNNITKLRNITKLCHFTKLCHIHNVSHIINNIYCDL